MGSRLGVGCGEEALQLFVTGLAGSTQDTGLQAVPLCTRGHYSVLLCLNV